MFKGTLYSGGTLIEDISANTFSELKKIASQKANAYNNAIDELVLDVADNRNVQGIKFMRINQKFPNNTIKRGNWS